MRKLYLFWAGLCVVAGIATACSQGDTTAEEPDMGTTTTTESPTTSAAASDVPEAFEPKITIVPMTFSKPITVAPGAQVEIVNTDTLEHTVTSQTPGLFDVRVNPGEKTTFTAPTQPGEYPYNCSFHPYMRGILTVQ